jgi:pimeloyl-ACP methyl ester carboxylesterase
LKDLPNPILHSRIIGDKIPLIILHGFLGSGDNWKSLGNRFAANGYQVHLVDQRNHGRSFRSEDFSYQLLVDDLKRYCEDHDLKEIILLGHSMGGKAAMLFAVTYPELVVKLIVADIGPKFYPQHHQDILKALSLLDFREVRTRNAADEVLSKYIKEAGTRQFLLKNLYWVQKDELGLRINLKTLTNKVEEVGMALPEGTKFSKSTLFLKGSNSEYILESDEVLIKTHFPLAKVQNVSNAGHWLHAENPVDFYSYVMEFILP